MRFKKLIIGVLTLLLVSRMVIWVLYLGNKYLSSSENTKAQEMEKHTLLIQGSFDSPVLRSIKDTLTPVIDKIIKDELGLSSDYDFNFFLPIKFIKDL
jgi:hypothetical protein